MSQTHIKVEPFSKAALAVYYKCSPTTIRRWVNRIRDNYTVFAERFNNPDYLSFAEYKSTCKNLTPKQFNVFKKHYGEV